MDAALHVAGWTRQAGEIYYASLAARPTAVVVDEKPLLPESSLEKTREGTWFYDAAAKRLYLGRRAGDAVRARRGHRRGPAI